MIEDLNTVEVGDRIGLTYPNGDYMEFNVGQVDDPLTVWNDKRNLWVSDEEDAILNFCVKIVNNHGGEIA